jgi:hypothetical protein
MVPVFYDLLFLKAFLYNHLLLDNILQSSISGFKLSIMLLTVGFLFNLQTAGKKMYLYFQYVYVDKKNVDVILPNIQQHDQHHKTTEGTQRSTTGPTS